MEKIFWSMGEVAEMLDVTPSLIRFWEKQFVILTPQKNEKGTRRFSAEDVANLKTIYHLVKERGMTLKGAAKHLSINRKETEKEAAIAEKLQSIRALLQEIKQEMDEPVGIVSTATENAIDRPIFTEQTLF